MLGLHADRSRTTVSTGPAQGSLYWPDQGGPARYGKDRQERNLDQACGNRRGLRLRRRSRHGRRHRKHRDARGSLPRVCDRGPVVVARPTARRESLDVREIRSARVVPGPPRCAGALSGSCRGPQRGRARPAPGGGRVGPRFGAGAAGARRKRSPTATPARRSLVRVASRRAGGGSARHGDVAPRPWNGPSHRQPRKADSRCRAHSGSGSAGRIPARTGSDEQGHLP